MIINDEAFLPFETLKSADSEEIQVKTKKKEFDNISKKHKVLKFEKAFPTAASQWLRKVYMIKCKDNGLSKEIKDKFRGSISNVELLSEPELLYTPNDFGKAINQSNLGLVKANEAWDFVRDLPKIPIGVTDTYFDTSHEDLSGQFISVVGGNTDVTSGHGTAVSGLLSARTDNNIGISAISYNARIYASSNWASDNEVLLLAQRGYRVINCSWFNSCAYSVIQDSLYSEINRIWNTVVVFGAGNNTGHCGSLSAEVFPASLNSVVSVTSIGHINTRGYNDPTFGKIYWIDCHDQNIDDTTATHHHNAAVDICAPGYSVSTTMASSRNLGKYNASWGTSFAAPQVASALSLVLSVNPCLTANEAINIIKNTADNSIYSIPENSRYIGLLGTGRLDVNAAVQWAIGTATINFSVPTNLSGTNTYRANYAIKTTASSVKVQSGSNITFLSRKEIVFNPGFEVQANSSFTAETNINNTVVCQ